MSHAELVVAARRVLHCPLNVSFTPALNDLDAAVNETRDAWQMLIEVYRVIVRARGGANGDKPHVYSYRRSA